MIYHKPNANETCVVHVVSVLANESLVRTRENRHFFNILPSKKQLFAHPLLSKVHTRLE